MKKLMKGNFSLEQLTSFLYVAIKQSRKSTQLTPLMPVEPFCIIFMRAAGIRDC